MDEHKSLVQAALWCHRAATGGDAAAVKLLPIIRSCDFCGKTPARQHCQRCRKVRYCGAACQAGHWKRETDPHKGHCRRRARRPRRKAPLLAAAVHHRRGRPNQGLTLVHFSARVESFGWDRGCA